MNPGMLDIPVNIYTDTITRDEYGGETKTRVLFIACRAREITQKGREKVLADKDTAIGFASFRVRYYPGITAEMVLEADGVEYDIKSIDKVGRKNYLDLHSEKRE